MKYVYRMRDLYEYFDPRALNIPEGIVKYDNAENGAYYKAHKHKEAKDENDTL